MSRLLWLQNLRGLARHPWQLSVPVVGVALGVASFVALDLAKFSAAESFERSTRVLVGQSTHAIVGGTTGVADAVYRSLRTEAAIRPSAPVVEGSVVVGDQSLTLLGIDPLADREFRDFGSLELDAAGGGFGALLTRPGALIASSAALDRLGISVGSPLALKAGGKKRQAWIVGSFSPGDEYAQEASRDLLIADISSAQELLGTPGRLTRIDLIVDSEQRQESISAFLHGLSDADLELAPAGRRSQAVDQMTAAFRTNLTALSLLGLLVGMFLIHNALTFSVVRRRDIFGRLRSIGVTRREIIWLVLGEGAVIGAIGTGVGLFGGVLLANALLAPVTQTLNDLYVSVRTDAVQLSAQSLALGVVLGMGATLAAALLPALEAASASPIQVMRRSNLEGQVRERAPRAAALGAILLGVTLLMLALSGRSLIVGLAAIFVAVVGYALLVPALTLIAMRLVLPLLSKFGGTLGRMAARGVTASLSRTGVAVAALAVAVSVSIGVDTMVGSFRKSVDEWLHSTLDADFYVASPSRSRAAPEVALDPRIESALRDLPGITSVSSNRRVTIGSEFGSLRLSALGIAESRYQNMIFVAGDPAGSWGRFRDLDAVVVSEPLAYRHAIRLDDEVELVTSSGPVRFSVVGIVRDYASDQGVLFAHLNTYRRYWEDVAVTALAIDADPALDHEQLLVEMRASVSASTPAGEVMIRSNRGLRRASLEIFDRTFAVTGVLQLIALVVAFAGIVGAMLALAMDRTRETAILRASGMLQKQIRALVMLQTSLLGLLAGLFSIPLGIGVALALVKVINMRSFGWSLDFVVAPETLVRAIGLSVIAAFIGGVYPAIAMSKLHVPDVLRMES